MLYHLLVIFGIAVLVLNVVIFFEIFLSLWMFIFKANLAIDVYSFFENIAKKDLAEGDKIRFEYIKGIHKYKLEFSDTRESYIKIEKLVEEALEYYDKLGWIASPNNLPIEEKKRELLQICSKVRMAIWTTQEQ